MKLKLGLAAAAFAVAATGFAAANEDIIGLRQQVMKTNGQAAKVSFGMAKGDIPFDATVAAAAMMLIADNATEFPHLFPAGTETGGNTKATEAIWSDPDGFMAAAMTAAEAAKAAAAAAADGQEAFGAAVGPVGGACGACHEKYRVKS